MCTLQEPGPATPPQADHRAAERPNTEPGRGLGNPPAAPRGPRAVTCLPREKLVQKENWKHAPYLGVYKRHHRGQRGASWTSLKGQRHRELAGRRTEKTDGPGPAWPVEEGRVTDRVAGEAIRGRHRQIPSCCRSWCPRHGVAKDSRWPRPALGLPGSSGPPPAPTQLPLSHLTSRSMSSLVSERFCLKASFNTHCGFINPEPGRQPYRSRRRCRDGLPGSPGPDSTRAPRTERGGVNTVLWVAFLWELLGQTPLVQVRQTHR